MRRDNLIAIAATEAEAHAEREPTLEGKLRAAMRATKNHWLITDENERFLAACAGVIECCSEEDAARIRKEIDMLCSFALGHLPDEIPKDIIGLVKLWRECQNAKPQG